MAHPAAQAPWRPWVSYAVCAIAFAATTLFLAPLGYLKMFSFFAPWDDEGYILLSLKSFRAGGQLYDQVYSQYGPFYYLVMDGLFSILRLSVSHDNGRLVSLGVWLAVSLISGLLLFGLSRNLWLGCCTQLLVFKSLLFSMHFEPMHPGGLICLLLVFVAGTAVILPAYPRLALALQGVFVASLALIKINIGIFAGLAVALTCVTAVPALARHRLLVVATAALATLTPLGLMAANLDEPWAQRYVLLVTAGIFAVALAVVRCGPDEPFEASHLLRLIGGAGATATVVCLAILLRGTSPGGLIQALVVQPLRQADVFTAPLNLPPHNRKIALASVTACLLVAFSPGEPRPRDLGALGAGLLRLATGLAIAISVSGIFRARPMGFLLVPLAWVAVLPPRGLDDPARLTYARRLLSPLAVLQTLHAYPVAGSQLTWGSFLLVPVGTICVFDGGRQVTAWARNRGFRIEGPSPRLLPSLFALTVIALVGTAILLPLRHCRALYADGVALPLPGSSRLRLPAEEAEAFTWLRDQIRHRCTTFVTLRPRRRRDQSRLQPRAGPDTTHPTHGSIAIFRRAAPAALPALPRTERMR